MNNREGYIFWRLAYTLIAEHGYRIIQLFENERELWLEKLENKKVPIIRMLHHDLDWSNAMQRDIEFTAANGERVRKQLGRHELHITNIYISQYPPVDDYQFRISSPFVNPEANKTTVSSILFASGEYERGFQQLSDRLKTEITFPIKEEYSEEDAAALKNASIDYAVKKVNTERAILTSGKPFFTYVFLILQIGMFLWLEMHGGSENTFTLVKYGAKVNQLIYDGEWWRFITPVFLHIGFIHLAMNSLSLYYLGTVVERMFGNARFVFIYLFAGFAGGLASFIFSTNLSAGASGAIYGLGGALLYFGLIYPKLFSRTLGMNLIAVLGLNLAVGFSVSSFDNAAHLGGLAGGFLSAGIVHLPKSRKPVLQLIFFVVSAAIIWGSLTYGFSASAKADDEYSSLLAAQAYIKDENYDKAYRVLKEAIADIPEPSEKVYFFLSYAEIKKGMLPDAKAHLQMAIKLDPKFDLAYYNLALIYDEEKDLRQAKSNAEKAAEINPNQKEYLKLIQEINQEIQSSGGGE